MYRRCADLRPLPLDCELYAMPSAFRVSLTHRRRLQESRPLYPLPAIRRHSDIVPPCHAGLARARADSTLCRKLLAWATTDRSRNRLSLTSCFSCSTLPPASPSGSAWACSPCTTSTSPLATRPQSKGGKRTRWPRSFGEERSQRSSILT